MTPDEAFRNWWSGTGSQKTLEDSDVYRLAWHAALAYAAGELRKWAEGKASSSGSAALLKAADRLSPPT